MMNKSASPGNALLIFLEFSASDPAQSISGALAESLPARPVEIDLIDVGYGRQTDAGRRALAIADDVCAAGAERVVLAASCAAAPMLAPVARGLAGRGIEVARAVAVDPGRVTEGHMRHSLRQISASLELPAVLDAIAGLDLRGPAGVVLARIERVLHDWVEEFLRLSGMDAGDWELVRSDLLDRYLRWHSFLLAMMDAPAQDPGCPLDVFLTDSSIDLVGIFGPEVAVRRHRFPPKDGPALRRLDVIDDLRATLTNAAATI
jgi:hypothetical protein